MTQYRYKTQGEGHQTFSKINVASTFQFLCENTKGISNQYPNATRDVYI